MNTKPDIRVIAMDMDCTLLTSEKTISPVTVEALKKAQEKGVYITLCTGRLESHGVVIAADAGLTCGAIGSNGCSVWDYRTRSVVRERCMKPEDAALVRRITDRYPNVVYDIHGRGRVTNSVGSHSILEKFGDTLQNDFGIYYGVGRQDVDDALQNPVYKYFLHKFVSPEQREEVRRALEQIPGIYVTASGPKNLEIMPRGVDKGTGIADLSDYLGIGPENVMVFGDFDNDMAMFLKAGYPVAMGNGTEEIKNAAFYVTDTNDNDGIAKAVEKFVL